MGFNDEEEFDVFDMSANAGAGAKQPKPAEDFGVETNVFSVEYDAQRAAAQPSSAATADDEFDLSAACASSADDEFDLSAAKPVPARFDDDDYDFSVEKESLFSRIRGRFAKPDIDDDIDLDDTPGGFTPDDDFPEENGGIFARIKGLFIKPKFDDDGADIDLDDTDGYIPDDGDLPPDDDLPEEKENFFDRVKGRFAKPDADDFDDGPPDLPDDDDFPEEKASFFDRLRGRFAKPDVDDLDDFDDLPDLPDDDYTSVSDDDDGDVFDMSSSAAPAPAPRTEPVFEAAEPEPEYEEFEAAEPEFEAVKAEFESFGSEPEPAVFEAGGGEDEFDLSAGAPPPAPAPLPPPVFNKIAHVCLHVKNLDASVGFYTKLGFTKRFAFNRKGRPFGVYLEFGGGNFIEIFEDGRGGQRGSLAHFCLETPDIDAAAASLASRGIEHSPKKLGSDSTYQVWLTDPDGNEFEIHQYTPESSQVVGRDVEADW